MKLLRLGLVTLLTALAAGALHAQAIWKWRTKDGRIEVSDRAPPVDVPEANILQRPQAPRVAAPAPAAPGADADGAANPVAAAASAASGPARGETELEAKRRKALADQAAQEQARQRAHVERVAAQKADTCRRARNQQASLESGVRIARPNDKGEREFLDDKGREEELQRTRELVANNCS